MKLFVIILSLFLTFSFIKQPQSLTAKEDEDADTGSGFSAGMSAYYAWWDPAWKDFRNNFITKSNTLLMAGPVVSYKLSEKEALTGLIYVTLADFESRFTDVAGDVTSDYESKIGRTDIDLTYSYKFSRYLNWFTGYKLMLMSSSDKVTQSNGTETWGYDGGETFFSYFHGAGLGIGVTLPVLENLYLVGNAAFLYIINSSFNIEIFEDTGVWPDPYQMVDHESDYTGIGGNATLAFSYFLFTFSTAVSIGGRYQLIKYYSDGDDQFNMKNDAYYGVILSFMYFF